MIEETKTSDTSQLLATITAQQLVKLTKRHKKNYKCKVCGDDCGRIGMVNLVYVFETCVCEEAGYTHLVERLYHRNCFVEMERKK